MYPGPQIRDRITAKARRHLFDIRNRYPFEHQASFWLAMEGYLLTDEVLCFWDHDPDHNVRHEQPTFDRPTFDVLVARYLAYRNVDGEREERIVTSDEFWSLNPVSRYLEEGPTWKIDDSRPIAPLVERRSLMPRPNGIANRVSILTGYKGGKSAVSGDLFAPMLICPGVSIDLIGMTYDTAEPEFKYIAQALFSEDGFNLPLEKPDHPGIYKQRMTNPRPGVMPEIVLSNESVLRVVSFENRENLKGKEKDCYLFAEYFQFPGLEAYTDIAQNLNVRDGFAVFPTTPDAPHIESLVQLGLDTEATRWHVTPNVPRSKNPYSFSFAQLEEDRKTKTREKFKIGQLGIIGEYIGSAFSYKRGERLFTTRTKPELWKNPDGASTRENCRIPNNWTVVGGADTGSHYAGVVAAFSDDDPPHMYVLDERANYRYVATEIEKSPTYTLSEWYRDLRAISQHWGGDNSFWADANAQLKQDATISAGVVLLPDHTGPEARTEILREYFQNNRIWFAPWLEIVPYECEMARFPPAGTSTGIWRRISEKDHALDPVEHIAAQRPTGRKKPAKRKKLWIEEQYGINYNDAFNVDPHFR